MFKDEKKVLISLTLQMILAIEHVKRVGEDAMIAIKLG